MLHNFVQGSLKCRSKVCNILKRPKSCHKAATTTATAAEAGKCCCFSSRFYCVFHVSHVVYYKLILLLRIHRECKGGRHRCLFFATTLNPSPLPCSTHTTAYTHYAFAVASFVVLFLLLAIWQNRQTDCKHIHICILFRLWEIRCLCVCGKGFPRQSIV